MRNKKDINTLIRIARIDINENLLYEYNFTEAQQKIMVNYFDELFKQLNQDILRDLE